MDECAFRQDISVSCALSQVQGKTSALIECRCSRAELVPVSPEGKRLLSGWQLLKQYPKGSLLFSKPSGTGRVQMGGTPWGVHVLHDPRRPDLHLSSLGHSLTMTFDAMLAGAEVTALFDTGAEANFTTPRLAPGAGAVSAADSSA